MPIYPYICDSCGHEFDKLQKVNDYPDTHCPVCGEESLRRKVTAAAFHLKGTGWYVTDFKNKEGKKDQKEGQKEDQKEGSKGDDKVDTKEKKESKKTDAKASDSSSSSSTSKNSSAKSESKKADSN